ncbi:hypothetical protein L5515_015961 [Caenorhabditis briggsae]|uniref:Uncharacterized protein n=1 Tax=Caenorhabditis briggsae TaxID=6238 RepID=A0AAE9EHH1_CAEBR|nr:hypothetical protein L5515_015961 [Caenorhabditis briggsae]
MAKSDHLLVHRMSNICGEFNQDQYATFDYKVTPEVLRIPSEGSLEITLTPLVKFGDGEKLVIIHLMSYIFEILDATGKEGLQTQFYGIFSKNEIIQFRIAVRKEKKDPVNEYEMYCTMPEGLLTVKHGVIRNRTDTIEMLKSAEFKLGTQGMIGNRVDWAKQAGCWESELSFTERNWHILDLERQFYLEGKKGRNMLFGSVQKTEQVIKRWEEMKEWEAREKAMKPNSERLLYSKTLQVQPQVQSPRSTKSSYVQDAKEASSKRSPTKSDKSMAFKSSTTLDESTKSGKFSQSAKSSGVSTKSGKSAKSERTGDKDPEDVEEKEKNKKKRNPCCVIM